MPQDKKKKPRRRFVFIGDKVHDDPSNPAEIVMYGNSFKLDGESVAVSGEAAAKLSGNAHFREEK